MSKEDVALQLTLKLLDNFAYNVEDYGGTSLTEHADVVANIASTIYNKIYESISH